MARLSECEIKLENAIDVYHKNMIATGASMQTIRLSCTVLADFRNFYVGEYVGSMKKEKFNYSDPSFTTVQAWRDSLVDRGLVHSTVNKYLTRLHTFFEFAADPDIGFYEKNPVSKRLIPNMAKETRRPYDLPLTNEQIATLWSNTNPGKNERGTIENWERNYAIVILLLTSKIRNSELLALTPNDLDWEAGEITIEHGKGDKFRYAPFTKIAQQAVRIYLKSGARPDFATDSDPLFGTCFAGGQYGVHKAGDTYRTASRQWLSKVVEHHVYMVTGVHGVRSHDLRHLGAYLDLNNGKRLEELQAELGHSSPTTTQIYSGRLTAKRNRGSVKRTMEEQEYQIARNELILTNDLELSKKSKSRKRAV